VSPEGEATESGGHSYFGVLIDNLTVDAWVVIIILMIMFVVAIGVMVGKTRLVGRIDKDNQRFMDDFRQMTADLTPLAKSGEGRFAHSSLFRIYAVGIQELLHRIEHYRSKGMSETLSVQAVNSIKAAMDAVMVREGHRLSSQMVLLTIAISGGPFLGLLGTVVGVMITFAAIAAAGDVNINAIAPGIAAALLATVAGLGVAIPALFGYNYLGSRIKNISADMHIFGDEFITKLAENYTE
jgi:biopolymer transport protein ExbB